VQVMPLALVITSHNPVSETSGRHLPATLLRETNCLSSLRPPAETCPSAGAQPVRGAGGRGRGGAAHHHQRPRAVRTAGGDAGEHASGCCCWHHHLLRPTHSCCKRCAYDQHIEHSRAMHLSAQRYPSGPRNNFRQGLESIKPPQTVQCARCAGSVSHRALQPEAAQHAGHQVARHAHVRVERGARRG